MTDCLACKRIDQVRRNENPYFITELEESFVVLCDHQRYPGYLLLLLKTHHEHLNELPVEQQVRFFSDTVKAATAIQSVFAPARLNYELLGNTMPHLHWHVIPRYDWDPEPGRPIWVRPAAERGVELPPEKLQQIRTDLKAALR